MRTLEHPFSRDEEKLFGSIASYRGGAANPREERNDCHGGQGSGVPRGKVDRQARAPNDPRAGLLAGRDRLHTVPNQPSSRGKAGWGTYVLQVFRRPVVFRRATDLGKDGSGANPSYSETKMALLLIRYF